MPRGPQERTAVAEDRVGIAAQAWLVPSLLNALRLQNEAFGHASQTGDHHQGYAGDAPTEIAAAAFEVPARYAQARDRDHWSNHVAAPVHDIQDSPFDGGRLLTLNSLSECGCGSQVLRSRRERRHEVS